MTGIEPAVIKTCIHAALNIAGEAVAHHQNVLPVFHAPSAKSGVKDAATGLFAVPLLSNKDVLELGPAPGIPHPAAL